MFHGITSGRCFLHTGERKMRPEFKPVENIPENCSQCWLSVLYCLLPVLWGMMAGKNGIFDETYWIPEINTNTVHFRSQWSNVPDYQVTLDENGIPVEILKLDSSGSEELSEDLLPGGDGNG